MNTNPGNSVNRNIPNSISSFFSSATSSITDGKALNYSIHTGGFGVPYATMALVTIIAGTFTYVTYTDYKNDPGDDIESDEDDEESDDEEEDDDNSNLGMFNPLNNNSVNSNPEDAEKKDAEDAEKTDAEDAEKKEPEDAEKKEQEDAEKKETEDAEKKETEDAEKKETEDAEKKEQEDAEKKAEEPGKQYTLGGKPRSRKIKPTKRKYTKRKTRG